jgi:hypothetical protein
MVLYPRAIVIYEAYTQDFLKQALVFCYIPPSLLLREPELLSMI